MCILGENRKKIEDKFGNYYFSTWQGIEIIQLIDRRQKHWNVILYLNDLCPEAVFWKSNDIFMIVGHDCSYTPTTSQIQLFVYVFDLAKQTRNHYVIQQEIKGQNYLYKVTLKEKGILASGGASFGDSQ